MNSQAGNSIASNSIENIYKGMHDMSSLARGIYESEDTIYDKEEIRISKVNSDVSRLLESLEKKGSTDETQ